MKKFFELYDAGRVSRFHSADVLPQSVGRHSWGVAMIVAQIYPRDQPMPPRLLMAALTHDCAEVVTGDTPATAKWASSRLKNALQAMEDEFNEDHATDWVLTQPEKRILRWADMFELVLYCEHLSNMGNNYAMEIMENGLLYLWTEGFPTAEAKELLNEFVSK